jgi:integrase
MKGFGIARNFLGFLEEERYLRFLKYQKGMGKPRGAPPLVSPDVIRDVLSRAKDRETRAWILIGATTGLRPETISRLEARQIEEGCETGIIHIRPEQGKTRREFFVPILPEIRDEIRNVKKPQLFTMQRFLKGEEIRVGNRNLQPRDLRKFCQQHADRCGISRVVSNFVLDHDRSNVIDVHYSGVSEDQIMKEWGKFDFTRIL